MLRLNPKLIPEKSTATSFERHIIYPGQHSLIGLHGMRGHVRPLQGHPQLEIIRSQLSAETKDSVVEYRVYNYKRQRNGTIVRGDGFSWFDLSWVISLELYWWIFGLSLQARTMLLEKSLSVREVKAQECSAYNTGASLPMGHTSRLLPVTKDTDCAAR